MWLRLAVLMASTVDADAGAAGFDIPGGPGAPDLNQGDPNGIDAILKQLGLGDPRQDDADYNATSLIADDNCLEQLFGEDHGKEIRSELKAAGDDTDAHDAIVDKHLRKHHGVKLSDTPLRRKAKKAAN